MEESLDPRELKKAVDVLYLCRKPVDEYFTKDIPIRIVTVDEYGFLGREVKHSPTKDLIGYIGCIVRKIPSGLEGVDLYHCRVMNRKTQSFITNVHLVGYEFEVLS